MRILVGGVSELFQGDLDVGRLAVERLLAEKWGDHVMIEELHYGAVAVTQRLQDLSPDVLQLLRPPSHVGQVPCAGVVVHDGVSHEE